ncbi:transglutaminase-like putative cysteine protease [Allocatelliglobosispora scoriae]|uniref:Transglutaminase-like putative cysteine protease n=1 Tax=Allocatelliglobosispora scoriae TaxID=643052 RepID=A0A841BJA5_9ACTN|nr:transglutaminase family protein [Allocatelliglobosispora scoriae]MBB5867286.1 transglutaminase-like putative cysteine protease [Allocatelliglobosispora scoriae]
MPPSDLSAPMLDHADLDLESARRISYRIEQRFRYTYDTPVTALSQRLIIVPRPRHGDLYRRAHSLEVTGARARRRTRQDPCGNTVVRVTAAHVEHEVEFRVVALLERVRGDLLALPATALRDPALRTPTALTGPDDRLRQLAADLARAGGEPAEIAERICTGVYTAMSYGFGVTSVLTTAAQALAGGVGVCQDYAHIMIALCRLAGLPARYVSGHLLGQGGTHAWVEVIVPQGGAAAALAWDPCHGRRTHSGYVTVAVGRDYTDVAPTSGSYVGAPSGRLTGDRRVGVISLDLPAA